MTNRELASIVKNQKPLMLAASETVRQACRCMRECQSGSVLVVDAERRLLGIFTGRDAVRFLAEGNDVGAAVLVHAMTRDLVTIHPSNRAIDALHPMAKGCFRHVPVTEEGRIKGVKGMELEEYQWQHSGPPRGPASSFRSIANVLKGQDVLLVLEGETVQHACRAMWERKCGSSLVVDDAQRLSGIFTGRNAVRVLATNADPATTPTKDAMTRNPVTMTSEGSAIDALRAMSDGGFRHLPLIENGKVLGVVSRGDFTGLEIDRLDEEEHLTEVIW